MQPKTIQQQNKSFESFLSIETDFLIRCVDTKEAARITGIPVESMTTLRSRGGGPRFLNPRPRLVRYFVYHLFEWMLSGGLKSNTSDSGTPCALPDIALPEYGNPSQVRNAAERLG